MKSLFVRLRDGHVAVSVGLCAALFGCSSGGDAVVAPVERDAASSSEPGASSGDASSPQGSGGDAGGGGEGGGGGGGGGGGTPKGLAAYCKLYIDCGGTYYSDEADCIKRTADWYAVCAKSEAALDAYGDCMVAKVTCATWNPKADQPGSVACGDEWSALQTARNSCGK